MPIPPDLDPDDIEAHDPPEDQPVQHGENHTRRPERAEALRGQGAKTRARNKHIAQGHPFSR